MVSSTHAASARTTCDTQAPPETKALACSNWRASSCTSSRTTMLVSAARMFTPDVFPDAVVHLLDRPPRRRPVREERPVDLLPGVSASAPDEDPVALGVPLDDRSGGQPQPAAHLGRDRDLPLGRQA